MRNVENYRPAGGFRKRNRFRFWIISSGLFLFGALLIGAAYFVLHSPWFAVGTISAPDLPGVSGEAISDALRVQMLANPIHAMLGPKNILFWMWGDHPDSLYRFPAVKNVELQTDFWSRSVSVTAEERQLWGVVCGSKNLACFGLDENGIVFSQVPDVSGSLILRITDLNNRLFLLGQPLFSRADWFANLKNTIESMDRNDFRVIAIKSVDLPLREWVARTAAGPDFYFSLNFMPDKFDSVLRGLGSEIDMKKTSYVDFRVPNRIYYK